MLMNFRGGPPLGGCMLVKILEADPIFGGCMLMNSKGGPPHLERGSTSRVNFYGSSGICT